jgi:hypothetical protein
VFGAESITPAGSRSGGHEPNIIRDAAFTTLGSFVALTSVLVCKKDFSFMRSGLVMLRARKMDNSIGFRGSRRYGPARTAKLLIRGP